MFWLPPYLRLYISGMDGRSYWHVTKGMWVNGVGSIIWPWPMTPLMTLTFDVQGQILKQLYFRNAWSNWHGTKGIWFIRILDSKYDLGISPYPWPWPWIFKVKFRNSCVSRIYGSNSFELTNIKAATQEWWYHKLPCSRPDLVCTDHTLRLRQNGRHFTDDLFKCIFLMKMIHSLNISLELFLRFEFTIFQHWFR